jgi:glycosyltransferase involved in cell wall biosynthesis
MDAHLNLSICIPAYDRPQFLEWTLARLYADLPTCEVIVSDDASPRKLLRVNCDRYIQHDHNIGPFPNHRFALMQATRKYAVYCADDDYLLPAQLEIALDYLQDHPECSAYIAPCEIWNEVNGKSLWNAFKAPERDFTKVNAIDLFNYIIQHHVWPEHVIYRTPVPIAERTRAYWCFTDLVDLLNAGSIHFAAQPFYRNLLVHPCGERVQLGNVQCLTFFDEYRAGLEVLAYGLFGEQPYKARKQINDMISAFICSRMSTASILYERQGNTRDSQMLRKRIAIADPRPDSAVEVA